MELYPTLHCHHSSDFCVKVGSKETANEQFGHGEGHKSQDSIHKPQRLRERIKSRSWGVKPMLFAYQPNALLLGQIGSSVNKRVLCA